MAEQPDGTPPRATLWRATASAPPLAEELLREDTADHRAAIEVCDSRAARRLLDAIHAIQTQALDDIESPTLFSALLRPFIELTGSTYALLAKLADATDTPLALEALAVYDSVPPPPAEPWRPTAQHPLAPVLLERRIVRRDATDLLAPQVDLPQGPPRVHALLGLPLQHGGKLVGILALGNAPQGYPAPLVEYLAPLVATASSILWANWNNLRRREAEAAHASVAFVYSAIARVAQELIAHLDTPVLLHRLCHLTTEALECDLAHVLLGQEEGKVFVPVTSFGATVDEEAMARETRVPREQLATLFNRLKDTNVVEVASAPLQSFAAQTGINPTLGRHLVLALRRGAQLVGILAASRRRVDQRFSPEQHQIAAGIARVASFVLANAQLIEELALADRVKSEFVSTMSHELRTPLNVIVGYTEMAEDVNFDVYERQMQLTRIRESAVELLDLIENTLDIARIDAGKEDVRLEPVQLPRLWAALRDACGRLPRHPGVSLAWSPIAAVEVQMDPRKLTVVLRNLVGNALKFTERGTVQVRGSWEDDQLSLRVTDSGPGIHPKDQQIIFELFRQADGSSTRQHGGTGLGLYIVRRYVQLMGGRVDLQSTPGSGAEFAITLPAPRIQ